MAACAVYLFLSVHAAPPVPHPLDLRLHRRRQLLGGFDHGSAHDVDHVSDRGRGVPVHWQGGDPSAVIEIVGLRKTYGDTAAVDSIDLEVRDGEGMALLGPSGCCARTTHRLQDGLLAPE